MKERVLRFGEGRSLVGVVCNPAEGLAGQDETGLLFLNSGLVHRVGPNRIYVDAARELASAGILTMRFDLSGVGDSEPRSDSVPFEERSVIEIRQAMDHLEEKTGVRRFILTGICSGADNAFDVASVDSRVLGIIPIDLYSAPSTGFRLHSYRQRVLTLGAWARLLTGKSDLWNALKARLTTGSRFQDNASFGQVTGEWDHVSKESCLEKFRDLARKGTHLCLVYSGDSAAYYNYQVLFRKELEAIEFKGQFQVVWFESADHIFTAIVHQKQLIQKLHECVRDFVRSERPTPVARH